MSALDSGQPLVLCGGLSFQEVPVEVRERAAFRADALPEALERLRGGLGLEEAVLVSTCNRVEYFAAGADAGRIAAGWTEFLRAFHGLPGDFAPPTFHLRERACVEHLFRMASGLESMVVGETEILGQIKDAYRIASEKGATGKRLNRLFQSSFAAAKEIRSRTQITRGSVSVGSVAVELAEKLFGALDGRTVMVLGAGATSERTARSLQSRGVGVILVANRTFAHAEELARELKGEAVHWDAFEERIAQVDIVISSTSAPHYVLTREKLEQVRRDRRGRPLFLIDLAVPRDIEPAASYLDDVYVYDIDDLESLAKANRDDRVAEVARCERLLVPHVDKFMAWAGKLGGPGLEGTFPA